MLHTYTYNLCLHVQRPTHVSWFDSAAYFEFQDFSAYKKIVKPQKALGTRLGWIRRKSGK